MKIHEYYKKTALISINDSIAALIPAIIIVVGNLLFFNNKEIMGLSVPFLLYGLICFQFYLFRMKQSITIEKNMNNSRKLCCPLLEAKNLLVMNFNSHNDRVLLFLPDGHLAGELKKYSSGGLTAFKRARLYVLCNDSDQILGFYKIIGNKKIEVFNEQQTYLGSFEITKIGNKELLDASGKYIGAVDGASFFMDERVYDNHEKQLIVLQKGWMPLEWSNFFPDPNTPVLTFSVPITEKEKLIRMSFLINEFFIKR